MHQHFNICASSSVCVPVLSLMRGLLHMRLEEDTPIP